MLRIPGESRLPLLEDLIDLGQIIVVQGWTFSLPILLDVFLLCVLNYYLLKALLLHLLESSSFELGLLFLYEHVFRNVSRSELVLTYSPSTWGCSLSCYPKDWNAFELRLVFWQLCKLAEICLGYSFVFYGLLDREEGLVLIDMISVLRPSSH